MSDSSTTHQSQGLDGTPSWPWRLWQLIVIPINYPAFVIGSAMMMLMVPIALIRHRSQSKRTLWLRAALHRGAKLWVGLNSQLRMLDVCIDDRRKGTKNEGPLLVIANHPSLIDILLITAALPNLCCVLKGALHYNPLFTLLIRNLDYLPNSDPERMLEEARVRLAAGEQLLIFPEGTRTEPGKPLEFRMGAAELAATSGVPVLPVIMQSNSRYLSKGYPWYRWPSDKLRYRLELGPTLPPSDLARPKGQSSRDSAAKKARRAARRSLNKQWLDHFRQRLAARGVGN